MMVRVVPVGRMGEEEEEEGWRCRRQDQESSLIKML